MFNIMKVEVIHTLGNSAFALKATALDSTLQECLRSVCKQPPNIFIRKSETSGVILDKSLMSGDDIFWIKSGSSVYNTKLSTSYVDIGLCLYNVIVNRSYVHVHGHKNKDKLRCVLQNVTIENSDFEIEFLNIAEDIKITLDFDGYSFYYIKHLLVYSYKNEIYVIVFYKSNIDILRRNSLGKLEYLEMNKVNIVRKLTGHAQL